MENRSDLALAVQFGNERLELTVDAESDLADLRGLLFSLTSLPPQRQRVSPLPAFCPEDTPLSKLFMDGQTVTLIEADSEEQQQQQVLFAEEDILAWQFRCSRMFFGGEAIEQPRALSNGRPLCFACSTTCRLPGDIQGWIVTDAPASSCGCASDRSKECLFAMGAPTPVQGRLREAMVASLSKAKRELAQRVALQSQTQTRQPSAEGVQIRARLQSQASQMRQYEDPLLQAQCLSLIPTDELERRARREEAEGDTPFREALFIELLRWFKGDFFSWVDKPQCQFCGAQTRSAGVSHSSPDEARWLAQHTEIFACTTCGSATRFPRYNHTEKLLETRRGRCGEWAQAFALCCRAMGYRTRMVVDWTDHVWVEIYSDSQNRWVHADPCETAYDRPLQYEAGWGKKLTYIVAIAKDEVVDVIRRYTRQWDQVKARRTLVPEDIFASVVDEIDREQRQFAKLDAEEEAALMSRREAEKAELASRGERVVNPEELLGRASGSQEWREARAEMGSTQTQPPGPEATRVLPPDSYSEVFNHQTFDTRSQQICSLVGSAHIRGTPGAVFLTEAENDQVGALWHTAPRCISQGFFSSFRFQIQRNGGDGADGFAFVIQAIGRHALGQGGCELGYGGIPNSLAIEFDTYESMDRCSDPNGNHISVHTCGNLPNSAHHRHSRKCARNVPLLADGRVHDVAIHYHENQIEVFLDHRLVLSVNLNLASLLGTSNAWIGFTAATGGLNQAHVIKSWSLHQ